MHRLLFMKAFYTRYSRQQSARGMYTVLLQLRHATAKCMLYALQDFDESVFSGRTWGDGRASLESLQPIFYFEDGALRGG